MTISATQHPNNELTKVWIVEDNRHFRDTVAEIVDSHDSTSCKKTFGSCEEALDVIEKGDLPDVVLMDIGLPGMNGIEGIKKMSSLTPSTQFIVLTVHEDDEKVFNALCAGACGYLLKPESVSQINEAIETVLNGGAAMNGTIARKVLDMFSEFTRPKGDYGLTEREREILNLIVEDRTQKEIADQLYLSPHTVDTHIRNIYAKLHVHSRTGAVAKALRENLL